MTDVTRTELERAIEQWIEIAGTDRVAVAVFMLALAILKAADAVTDGATE